MYHRIARAFRHLMVLLICILGCSEESNLMQYAASKDTHEGMVEQAEAHFNKGEFDKAIALGEKARALDPGHEKTAVILGFSYLALGGIDPIKLASEMGKDDKDKDKDSSKDKKLLEEQKTDSDSNTLGPLKDLLGLGDKEIQELTLPGNQVVLEDGSVVKGAPDDGVFKEYPILFPKSASAARATVRTLQLVNQAIQVICPFVADSARLDGEVSDARHSPDVCPRYERHIMENGKIHFVWSFAHLIEAIAFNSVVLYDPTGKGPNLTKRSDALGKVETVGITNYVNGVKELAVVMDLIFPIDPDKAKDAMLGAMVNDLTATGLGFDRIPGLPESMTKSIKKTLLKLEEQKAKIKTKKPDSVSESEASLEALKGSMTEELGKKLETQIQAKVEANSISAEDKAAVCAAYSQISGTSIDVCSASGGATTVPSGATLSTTTLAP